MNAAFEKRLALVWIVLSGITIAQAWLGAFNGQATITPNAAITTVVIVISFIKVRIILREFMEVRHAPVLLCRLTDGWLLLTAATLLVGYFLGMALAVE